MAALLWSEVCKMNFFTPIHDDDALWEEVGNLIQALQELGCEVTIRLPDGDEFESFEMDEIRSD
jgi:hypothetical protein